MGNELRKLAIQIYLTKLQKITKIEVSGGKTYNSLNYNSEALIESAVKEAKGLIKETEPKPLEWFEYQSRIYSKGGEFIIYVRPTNPPMYSMSSYGNPDLSYLGENEDLEVLKKLAEFTRTK